MLVSRLRSAVMVGWTKAEGLQVGRPHFGESFDGGNLIFLDVDGSNVLQTHSEQFSEDSGLPKFSCMPNRVQARKVGLVHSLTTRRTSAAGKCLSLSMSVRRIPLMMAVLLALSLKPRDSRIS